MPPLSPFQAQVWDLAEAGFAFAYVACFLLCLVLGAAWVKSLW